MSAFRRLSTTFGRHSGSTRIQHIYRYSVRRPSIRKMATDLPTLPDVEKVSTRVIRILGGNPGKYTLQGTNTYLVGTGRQRILIDTGEGIPIWGETLSKVLADEQASVSDIVLTHWHPDHVRGVPDVLKLYPDAIVHKNKPEQGQADIRDGQVFTTEGAALRAFFSPGHTADHIAFVLEDEDAMFTGDNVLGHGTAVFEDLSLYMDSLERMKTAFSGRAYPGHGAVIEQGPAKVAEYISHRRQREQEALDVLARPRDDGSRAWQSMELVKVIYKAYPEALHVPAEGSLLQVLKKLQKEGKVEKDSTHRWSLTESNTRL